MLKTITGRAIPDPPPYPKDATNRKVINWCRSYNKWLQQQAVDEADSRGDTFAAAILGEAFHRMAEPPDGIIANWRDYLFSWLPTPLPPPFFRTLS